MSSNGRCLLDEALRLPIGERAESASRLRDSGGEATRVTERAWIAEAKFRLAEIERGEVQTVPWAEARHRIFAR
jgi:putative addiction module component (TIGR02574 family)